MKVRGGRLFGTKGWGIPIATLRMSPYCTEAAATCLHVGKPAGDDPKSDPAPKGDQQVPMCYHTNSENVYREIAHELSGPGFLDLSANDGQLALLAIKMKMPYLGFAFGDEHVALLQTWLEQQADRTLNKYCLSKGRKILPFRATTKILLSKGTITTPQ